MRDVLDKILKVSNKELDALETKYIGQYNFGHDVSYFSKPAGQEHYRLLMYISTLYKGKRILDVGTNKCMSAAALCYSMKNMVYSYDVVKLLMMNPILPYVEYHLGQVTEEQDIKKFPFIFLDVDHDGKFENFFRSHLEKIGWKGILVLDDIHLNEPMKEFWNSFVQEKYDLTKKGHWSGTGLVYYE